MAAKSALPTNLLDATEEDYPGIGVAKTTIPKKDKSSEERKERQSLTTQGSSLDKLLVSKKVDKEADKNIIKYKQ